MSQYIYENTENRITEPFSYGFAPSGHTGPIGSTGPHRHQRRHREHFREHYDYNNMCDSMTYTNFFWLCVILFILYIIHLEYKKIHPKMIL
jgi:hypothetical protein